MTKKAEVFKGRVIKFKRNQLKGLERLESEIITTTLSFEEVFRNKYNEYTTYDTNGSQFTDNWTIDREVKEEHLEVLQDNINLYKIAKCEPDGDLKVLYNFREKVGTPNFYRDYATKQDIEKLINSGFFVAVKGIGEISSTEDII